MNRIKSFDATGVAPNGRLYAGDLNLLQDTVAALSDYAQNLAVGSLAVGAADTTLTHYGPQEMAVSGLMRVLGVFRAASGIVVGSYTTTARDALVNPAYGLVILNQTTNKYEWNSGTPSVPVWVSLGGSSINRGTKATMPGAAPSNANTIYLATDENGGTPYYSDGATWTKLAAGAGTPKITTSPLAGGPPAAPNDGDIWIATDVGVGAGLGVGMTSQRWMFQYDSAEATSYKWKYLGGPKLCVNRQAGWTSAGSYANRSGLYVTAVRAGHYCVDGIIGYADVSATNATEQAVAGIGRGSTSVLSGVQGYHQSYDGNTYNDAGTLVAHLDTTTDGVAIGAGSSFYLLDYNGAGGGMSDAHLELTPVMIS